MIQDEKDGMQVTAGTISVQDAIVQAFNQNEEISGDEGIDSTQTEMNLNYPTKKGGEHSCIHYNVV